MRLDFNVLWVDDQPARVANQIIGIKAKMSAEGFDFRAKQCISIDQVEDTILENVFTDEVDLILVDWDLGNGDHGEDAIERIRSVVQYKDVVFYSGQLTVAELREKAYEKKLEGIYCASREDLVDEVLGVFDSLIKKVLDLDHTRGIVMGATSDIDHMVNACLELAHSKLDDAGKAKFIADAIRRVDEQVDNVTRQGAKLKGDPSVEALFKAHMLFTSDHRLRFLASILGTAEFAAYATGAQTVQSYRDGVVRSRNKLGHVILVPEGKPDSVMDDVGVVVGIAEMRELRKLILALRTEFRTLLDTLRA
ncbi:hypothetical protein [Pseudoxanthomonas sp.]|uniref:hypothetical protein n=1 Tax=Pseudoxanthomonas sp. TaxID=1871049 RepID=UPI0025DA0E16|nr:hypothetical protein [Pseudoxanthomonas sp.]